MAAWKDKEDAIRNLEVNGEVDPNDLIDAAREPSHPCHEDFTWDKDAAAVKQWRTEARKLIRAVGFLVKVEHCEVSVSVCQYVSSPDEELVFTSLPKMRSKGKVSIVMHKEVTALHGHAARAYGIALAKANLVGQDIVTQLQDIRDQIGIVKKGLEEK